MSLINVIPGSAEWQLAKVDFLSASEAAAACNLSRYVTRNSFLQHKRLGKDAPQLESNQAMLDGLAYEHIITERVTAFLEVKSEEVKMYHSNRIDWISCTPDRKLAFSDGRIRYVELKLKTHDTVIEAPDIEHIIQAYIQMYVMRQIEIYIAYSTKEQLKAIFKIKMEQHFLLFLLERLKVFRQHWIARDFVPIPEDDEGVHQWTPKKIQRSFKIQRII